MSNQMFYMPGMELQADGRRVEGNRHIYTTKFSTQRMNSQAFHMSEEVTQHFGETATDLPMFLQHNSRSTPSGRTLRSWTENGDAYAEYYIQKLESDPESHKIIELLDGNTLKDTSLGALGGEFYCDLDGKQMEAKADWFWVSHVCENGHTLGRVQNIEGEKKRITAQLRGKPHLYEISLVGIGADPGAKVLEFVKKELASGELSMEDLPYIADITNINLSNFCMNLGVSLQDIPTLGGSPPEPTKRIFDMSANLSTDVKVLQDTIKELQKNNTTLSTENTELKTKVAEYEQKMPVLQQQAQDGVNLKDELEKTKQELETLKGTDGKDAENYKAYKLSTIRQALTNYRNWRGLTETQAGEDALYLQKQKELEAMESIDSIISVGASYLGMTHDQNKGGRKSTDSPPMGGTTNDAPYFSGSNHL